MSLLKGVGASFRKNAFKEKGCAVKKDDFFSSRYYNTIFPTAEKMQEAWEWCGGVEPKKEEVKKVKD